MSLDFDAVNAHLEQACLPLGVDPHAVFLNEIDDVIGEQIVMSRSLLEEVLHHLEQGVEPTYDPGLHGLFSAPETFDAALRVQKLRLPGVERVIRDLLEHR